MSGERPTRSVLVALDASPASLRTLSAAAGLAALLGARLEGLFVEDEDLLRAAGLPFATVLAWPAGVGRPLDRAVLERELRALAGQARRALEAEATPRRLEWTFRVARGRIEVEVMEAARSTDLAVLGAVGRPALARPARRPQGGRVPEPAPVVVVHDGSAEADRALALGADLAGEGGALALLVPAGSATEAAGIAAAAWQRLGRAGPAPHRWAGSGLPGAVRAARGSGASLVLPASSAILCAGGLALLVEEAEQPVILVR